MSKAVYSIANWADRYETCETKKLNKLSWVPVPNKLDGIAFKRLVQLRNRVEIFAAWVLILEVASRVSPKELRTGELVDKDLGPLGAEELALITGFPENIFQEALDVLSSDKFGWIVKSPATPGVAPEGTGCPSAGEDDTPDPAAPALEPPETGNSVDCPPDGFGSSETSIICSQNVKSPGTTANHPGTPALNRNKKEKKKEKEKEKEKESPPLFPKIKFFENVFLTEDEHKKLVEKHGEGKTKAMLEKLSNYKLSTGKKYKSDYHTILNWVVESVNERESKIRKTIHWPQIDKNRAAMDEFLKGESQ